MTKLLRKKMRVANNKRMKTYYFLLSVSVAVVTLSFNSTFAQDSLVNQKRLRAFTISSAAAYGLTLYGLNRLWYTGSEKQSFRFFNDIPEWKQVDKLGHFYSSFYFSYSTSQALRWCGVKPKKTDVVGALTGFLLLLPIEVFDGFSDAYGASAGDLIANAAGSSFFIGQKLIWKEIRLIPKFSFSYTAYASQRPQVLGDNPVSEILKDYNGQTYWLSVDTDKFITFPKWLNMAVGYGATGMIYARDSQNAAAGLDPYRQYYFAVDLDISALHTRSKLVKTLLFLVNTIKIPTPAVEFSRKGVVFHPLHF